MTQSAYAKTPHDRNDPWQRWAALLGGLALFAACSGAPSSDRPGPATGQEKASMNQDMTLIQRAETTWAETTTEPARTAASSAPVGRPARSEARTSVPAVAASRTSSST